MSPGRGVFASGVIYAAGNAGNGGNPQPDAIITGTGAQILTPAASPRVGTNPRHPHTGRKLQHHPARQPARQDRQGHQLQLPGQGDGLRFDPQNHQKPGGLQKWIRQTDGSWKQAYTVQAGLDLGTPYTVKDYPTGNTEKPWAPATDGLRAITGRHNPAGSVTLYAVTSTISGSVDNGADPDKLVTLTDQPAAPSPTVNEAFTDFRNAQAREVLRGVSLTQAK